jgi:hypothetical protein
MKEILSGEFQFRKCVQLNQSFVSLDVMRDLRTAAERHVVSELLKCAVARFTFHLHLNDLHSFIPEQNEYRAKEY